MITRDKNQFIEQPMERVLTGVLSEFTRTLPRLERLQRYFSGRHDVLARSRAEGLPNTRLPHGFPRYIAQVGASFLLSEPVRYQDADHEEAVQALETLYAAAGADQADMELAMQQAVFGRAVSLNYHGEQGQPRIAALDPRSAFVVYDDTVEHRPLMGLMLSNSGIGGAGKLREGSLSVYTDSGCTSYALSANSQITGPRMSSAHQFSRVPMVEYLNEAEAHGDFEDVLPLIDAYDLLSSDRLNDRAQFADALLVLTGVMGLGTAENPYDHRTGIQRLRQEKTLTLPDSDASAKWLVKDPMEGDIDVLRQALSGDIHKFSMTPDFGDERFAGNVSGIAIKYKLFCLEQRIRLKERWFMSGLRERARVMAGYMRSAGMPELDPERLTICFTHKIPEEDN